MLGTDQLGAPRYLPPTLAGLPFSQILVSLSHKKMSAPLESYFVLDRQMLANECLITLSPQFSTAFATLYKEEFSQSETIRPGLSSLLEQRGPHRWGLWRRQMLVGAGGVPAERETLA